MDFRMVTAIAMLSLGFCLIAGLAIRHSFVETFREEQRVAKVIRVNKYESREYDFIIVRDEYGDDHQIACRKQYRSRFGRGCSVQIFRSKDGIWRISA